MTDLRNKLRFYTSTLEASYTNVCVTYSKNSKLLDVTLTSSVISMVSHCHNGQQLETETG